MSIVEKNKRLLSAVILILFAIAMLFTGSIQTAHATEGSGWIEVRCAAPEGFTDNATIILLNLDTNDQYKVTCRAINDYLDHIEVPYGSYSVFQAFTSADDTLYHASADPIDFEVSEKDLAAKLITVTVHEYEPLVEPDVSQPPEETAAPEEIPEVPSAEPSEKPVFDDVETDFIEDYLTPEDATNSEENNADENTADEEGKREPSLLKRIILAIVGTGVFAGIVFLFAYFYRRNFVDN